MHLKELSDPLTQTCARFYKEPHIKQVRIPIRSSSHKQDFFRIQFIGSTFLPCLRSIKQQFTRSLINLSDTLFINRTYICLQFRSDAANDTAVKYNTPAGK